MITTMNSQDESISNTMKRLQPIKGGAKPITISYVASLPTKHIEIHVVVVNIQIKEPEETITLKFIPLAIPHIRVGVVVTMIDIIIYASKVFITPNIILKDTPITKRPRPDFVFLAEFVETTNQQHVDDLVIGVEQVALGD